MIDQITGEPVALYCAVCREYIPADQAQDIFGQDFCTECAENQADYWQAYERFCAQQTAIEVLSEIMTELREAE